MSSNPLMSRRNARLHAGMRKVTSANAHAWGSIMARVIPADAGKYLTMPSRPGGTEAIWPVACWAVEPDSSLPRIGGMRAADEANSLTSGTGEPNAGGAAAQPMRAGWRDRCCAARAWQYHMPPRSSSSRHRRARTLARATRPICPDPMAH